MQVRRPPQQHSCCCLQHLQHQISRHRSACSISRSAGCSGGGRRAARAAVGPAAAAVAARPPLAAAAATAWYPQSAPVRQQHVRAGAAGRPNPPSPEGAGTMLSRSITRDIVQADSLTGLEDVVNEWGSSFDNYNSAAALVKLPKLRGGRSAAAQPLLRRLNSLWRQQMPEAETRQLANVLWAWGRLGAADQQLWDETMAACVEGLSAITAAPGGVEGAAQWCVNVLWACAKLRRSPRAEQLQAVLEAFVRPEVLQAAMPQHLANSAWALSQLRSARGYQGGISADLVQQLLGQEQLQLVAFQGKPQELCNALLALARLAAGDVPLVSRLLAQQCAQQLLDGAKQRGLGSWPLQETANALWVCGELQLADEEFLEAAIACLVQQLPSATVPDLVQLADALAKLQCQDGATLMSRVLKRGQQVVQGDSKTTAHSSASRHRPVSLRDRANLAAMVPEAVAALDMRELAGDVVTLVACSGVGKQQGVHRPHLRRLWQVHCWLRQHSLLDGRGLAGLVTEQQLQHGEREAATWGGTRL